MKPLGWLVLSDAINMTLVSSSCQLVSTRISTISVHIRNKSPVIHCHNSDVGDCYDNVKG